MMQLQPISSLYDKFCVQNLTGVITQKLCVCVCQGCADGDPGVWVLARSRSLSLEEDSDFRPYLFHLCILLQSIRLLRNLFYS